MWGFSAVRVKKFQHVAYCSGAIVVTNHRKDKFVVAVVYLAAWHVELILFLNRFVYWSLSCG